MDSEKTLKIKTFGNAYSAYEREMLLSEVEEFCENHSVQNIEYIKDDNGIFF